MLRRLLTPFRVLVHSVRKRGLKDTYGRAVRAVKSRREARRRTAADRAFDAERRIETAAWVRSPDLVTESPNRRYSVRYQPSSAEEFALLMGKLDVDVELDEFVFVDYGSGKGRVLILAAEHPFKRIVGVEFSPPLNRIARENIATLGPDAARIETVEMDATEFEPPLEPLVVYFFNPFELPVLLPVLDRLRASLERHPRPAYLVVTGPPELAQAIEDAGFASVDVDRFGWLTRGVFAWAPARIAALGTWATALGSQYGA